MSRYLLGLDIGTSACKAAVFDGEGRVLAETSEAYPVQYPHPGWAEQQPDDWWQAVCRALKKLARDVNPSCIAGVGVDGQSWSAVAVDAGGNVLCPTPIWTDTRARAECEEMRRCMAEEDWFQIGMNPLQPGYTLPKILWYKNHRPEVYENARWILQSNSFIAYRLTGHATQDVSQGYGLQCYDVRRGQWNTEAFARLGLRPSLLPPLLGCSQVAGHVTDAAAAQTGLLPGIPVAAGGLDAACATLGVGVIDPGQTQEQGGQAGGMSLCLDQCAGDPRLILGAHVVPGRWLLQGGTTGGGGALKWLRETICPELSFEEMSRLAQDVSPGSDGLLFLPYLAGERSPIWNPEAKGVFFGLTYAHSRAHMIRAVMEGTAYALRHNLETARSAGGQVSVMRAMGGSANSLVWTQIKSDVTGKPIEVPSSDRATVLGAAILAGVGVGVYPGFAAAAEKTVRIQRTHAPQAAHQTIYDAGYQRYLELYRRLEPMMTGRDRH